MFPTLVSHSDSDLTNKLNAVLPIIKFQLKEVLCSGVEVLWLGVAVDGGRPGGHPRTRDITGSVRIMQTPRIEGSVTVEFTGSLAERTRSHLPSSLSRRPSLHHHLLWQNPQFSHPA